MNRFRQDALGPARFAAELLVIVLGVLIALSADAWNQARVERSEEARHLSALRDDISESIASLEVWRLGREGLEHSLLRLLEADLSVASPDSVGFWVQTGFWSVGIYEPRLAAMRDLEATGEIGLLPPEVRLAIAELDQRLGEFRQLEDDLMASQQGLVDPFLVAELPLAPILAVADTLAISEVLSPGQDWSAIRSRRARSMMAFKLSLTKEGFERGAAVAGRLEELMRLIDGRLLEVGGKAG